MKRNLIKVIICLLSVLGLKNQIYASQDQAAVRDSADGIYMAFVEVPSVNINREYNQNDVLVEAYEGEQYPILEDMGDGWLKVAVNGTYGYIPMDGNTSVIKVDQTEQQNEQIQINLASQNRRQVLVNYALQFVGGRYRYGGDDPRSGVDCSGFTRYVLLHGAGVSLSRASQSQAVQGVSVSAEQIRPGDLVFYGSSKRINHVGLYIGNGQVVHASTRRTGIKVSEWTYRQPIKIVNVMGD